MENLANSHWTTLMNNLIDFDNYYLGYVGTLSVREAIIMSEDVKSNFLNVTNGFYLMNASGLDSAYYFNNGKVEKTSFNNEFTVRPVGRPPTLISVISATAYLSISS